MKPTKQARTDALDYLRRTLKPGDTLHLSLKHVSRSGMSRSIGIHFVAPDRSVLWLSRYAFNVGACDGWDDRREACKMGGCGMDMGFALVYNLGRILWPDGTPEPHGTRNGEPDTDGGYALIHRWL